ncbi:MAG: hypothetical protein IPN76_06845 [Saprospiraceae bacterium]|nr:hypothetical protein [Saprospiraceae bacterium]
MWEGIIVEGTPFGSQSTAGGINAQQGWVSLYSGGVIEHAKVGIRLETQDGGYGGGGILNPCRGAFINCTTSIRFGAYVSSAQNSSNINGAQFYLDDSYRGGSDLRPIFVDAWFVTNPRVRACWFKDDRSVCDPADKALGIDSKAASIIAISNGFHNLSKAIVVDQPLIGSFQANTNGFTRCFSGIESNKVSNFSIRDNSFQIAAPPNCSGESVGVTLSGNSAGFSFTKNTFTGLDNEAVGTVVRATGTANKSS